MSDFSEAWSNVVRVVMILRGEEEDDDDFDGWTLNASMLRMVLAATSTLDKTADPNLILYLLQFFIIRRWSS